MTQAANAEAAAGQMIATVRSRRPDAEFVSAELQRVGTAGQMVHLGMKSPGHLAFANLYYFDASGKLIGDGGFEEGGAGQQILGVLQPLHFGWFGGIGTKIIYGILGLALTVITQSGVVIWLARRRDKGRPAPIWERVWAAVVWCQPLALAVTAAAALFVPEHWILGVYVAIVAASLVMALRLRDAATAKFWLQVLSATALAVLVIFHIGSWWGKTLDPVATPVNFVLVAIAALLAAPALMRCLTRVGACG